MAESSYMIAPGQTQGEMDQRRKLAMLLHQQSMQPQEIKHWAQGLANLANSAITGYELYDLDRKDREETAKGNEMLVKLLQGGGSTAAPAPAAGPAPVGNAGVDPMGKLPAMGSRVYSENEFNPMDAAVATPDELAAGVNAPKKYAALIGKAAVDNDLPPNLLAAQLRQESGFNPNAVSPAGATGISQFMPGTAREMGVTDPTNPDQAIPAGARYLRQNIDRFGGSVPLGLAAYNAGPGRVERAGGDISRLPAETQGYVAALSRAAPAASAPVQTAQAGPNKELLIQMLSNRKTAPMAQAIMQSQIGEQFKPRDQWVDERGQDGSFYQRNARTNERKVIEKSDVLPDDAVKQKVEIAKASKPETTINNTVNPILKGIGDRFNEDMERGRSSVDQIKGIYEARRALDGGAITGLGADPKLFLAKVGTMFGLPDNVVANTETARAALGEQVLASAKALGANPSNADRVYIEKVKGGSIELNETSLRKIMDIQEKWARDSIRRANSAGQKMLQANPKELGGVSGMLAIEEPEDYATWSKSNPAQAPQSQPAPGKVRKYNPATRTFE